MTSPASRIVSMLVLAGTCAFAAGTPEQRMRDLHMQGVEGPSQTLEVPTTELITYGDHAVEYCFVFSSFVALETDTGQVGAEAIYVRVRDPKVSADDLCRAPRQPDDQFLSGAEGYVVGAQGPFLFVTSTDSGGSSGGVSIFEAARGKKLFEVRRTTQKPLIAQFEDGVLSLHYFAPLTLDCDLASASCWDETLKKNHVPADAILVRPECGRRSENTVLSTPVHVSDVAHAALVFENSQPSCL